MPRLTAPIREELKAKHHDQYEAIKSKQYPKKMPNILIKFFDVMESLTDKPAEWLLKLRRKL